MGLLIDGVWQDRWYDTNASGGRFVRQNSVFRHWVTPDGSPGPSGEGGFKAELGRYHLYVSYACPWAHRTLILRALKGLDKAITISVVHWEMKEQGWTFADGEGVIPDPLFQSRYLHQIYTRANMKFTGRVTVPVLWDKDRQTIVNNESSEILRMFNYAFDDVGAKPGDFYPNAVRSQIDSINDRVYRTLNNGVYRAGFATTQAAYDEAIDPLFATLDWLEVILAKQRYLVGNYLTEADWRLFTTLIRFDLVYVGHFKCNRQRLIDYPNLWAYTRELYQLPKIAETVHFGHIKQHYYQSHPTVNPSGVVPVGPKVDFTQPHDRDRF